MLEAADPIEAIRLRADRLLVVRRGTVIAEAPAKITKLTLPGRPSHIDSVAFAPKMAGDSALRVARAG